MRRTATSVAMVWVVLAGAGGAAHAAPGAPVDLAWRAVGRASALRWLAPGGDPVAAYEVRGAPTPIDEATFAAASPLGFSPAGTPRPPGVLEFRELTEVEAGEGEEAPAVLDDALYFAVRALDATGAPGPIATADGFELVRVRVVRDRADRVTVLVRARFAPGRAGLDAGSGDLRLRLEQEGATVLDETVPMEALAADGGGIRARRPTVGIRLVRVTGARFARLTVKTAKFFPLPLVEGDLTVRVDLGGRPLAATGTLRAAGRRLVYP